MKLYATTTSERASKGQGGNKFIEIDLRYGSKNNSIREYFITYTKDKLIVEGEEGVLFENFITKGKSQKGEMYSCDNDDISCPIHTKH